MPGKREKKNKTTSDDILASLFEDIKTVGPVEDIAGLLKKEKKKKDGKRKKAKDKSKSRESVEADESRTKKQKRSKRSPTSDSQRRSRSPPKKRKKSQSSDRRRSPTPTKQRARRGSLTPPMYRQRWDRYRSKFEWGQSRDRGRDGLLPWERDRWSRSPSWSPTRYVARDRAKSPRPRQIDENRIDKAELLRIARKNVSRLAMEGRLPKGMELGSTLKNKSIKELIDFCYEIQKREFEVPMPESFVPTRETQNDDDKTDFSTFPIRSSIRIRIKDGVEKSARSKLERLIEENALRDHFPVSSGETHKGDKDWKPVDSMNPGGGIVSTLSKKTIKIPTAYTAYRLKDGFKARSPPDNQQTTWNGLSIGFDSESTSTLLPPPPVPELSSFDEPASSPPPAQVPQPAPLTIVSNEEFMAEAEKAAARFEAANVQMNSGSSESTTLEEIPSQTSQTEEPKLPEGAVLDKPVAPTAIGGLVSRRARLVKELGSDRSNHQLRLEIADIDLKVCFVHSFRLVPCDAMPVEVLILRPGHTLSDYRLQSFRLRPFDGLRPASHRKSRSFRKTTHGSN